MNLSKRLVINNFYRDGKYLTLGKNLFTKCFKQILKVIKAYDKFLVEMEALLKINKNQRSNSL